MRLLGSALSIWLLGACSDHVCQSDFPSSSIQVDLNLASGSSVTAVRLERPSDTFAVCSLGAPTSDVCSVERIDGQIRVVFIVFGRPTEFALDLLADDEATQHWQVADAPTTDCRPESSCATNCGDAKVALTEGAPLYRFE